MIFVGGEEYMKPGGGGHTQYGADKRGGGKMKTKPEMKRPYCVRSSSIAWSPCSPNPWQLLVVQSKQYRAAMDCNYLCIQNNYVVTLCNQESQSMAGIYVWHLNLVVKFHAG